MMWCLMDPSGLKACVACQYKPVTYVMRVSYIPGLIAAFDAERDGQNS